MSTVHEIKLQPLRTYATADNARKAVAKIFGPDVAAAGSADAWYFITRDDEGRYFPVFVGERALKLGVHHSIIVVA